MLDLLIRDVMEQADALVLPPDTSVRVAAQRMADRNTGAVMVVQRDELVGMFTERDALYRVIARGRDPDKTLLDEVMTREPQSVAPGDTYGYALVLMQEGGFRHAPVVEDGRPIGIVSSRNAMDPELEEFASEENRRRHMRRGH
jgi:CBS domain-containing protein